MTAKRVFDVVLSSVLLLLLSPLIIVLSWVSLLILGRHILFIQTRPGLNGKAFDIWKFRTMRDERDASGKPLPDAERLTSYGRFLRATSLDELPELWNILKGEMSFVGPRPLLMQYLPLYSPRQSRRHEVLPGLTGWAQVNGRNAISWEDKFELDVWYVEHRSFALDLKILALTTWKVLSREGISAAGEATAAEFKGSRAEPKP